MVSRIFDKGKKIFTQPQDSVLSAATVIMIMIIASRLLGLVRQRVLLHFFPSDKLALFFAAFRLPDLVFEVLVFGTFASAFIPVFTRAIKKSEREAWEVAASVANIGLLIFVVLSLLVSLGARDLYSIIAPGFKGDEQAQILEIFRILFAAQGFFVLSYVLTGVLESLRRFLVPALAPLFYNLGIIFGTILFGKELGLIGPAIGVLIGASAHFLIQLPLAWKLGFRFRPKILITNDVKKIGKLALPRIIEVSFMQIARTAELFFASLISTASYTYFTLGNSIQLIPVGLFGTSIAKAALPSLSANADNMRIFKRTLVSSLNQIIYFVLPVATILIVLRIPIVRLIYGTDLFDWTATVQTGWVISAFAVGVLFQAIIPLLARSFYALHNTKLPVTVSMIAIFVTISFDFLFIKVLGYSVWGLAAALSIGACFQALVLFYYMQKTIDGFTWKGLFRSVSKSLSASICAGIVMFMFLKLFDRSVWVKRLSFLTSLEATKNLPFDRFVLDTRYTVNLLILTLVVAGVGAIIYIGLTVLLKSKEAYNFINLISSVVLKRKIAPVSEIEQESVTPTPTDTVT